MIFRAEPDAIMFFSVSEGKTGIISGKELEKVVEWANRGKENEFVNRLKKLNILDNDLSILERQRNELLKVITLVEGCKGPIRSFSNPESIHIDLTTKCNLDCIQCYKDRSLDVNLSFDQLITFIREAADMKVFQIAFGGGEPLLYPFIKEAVYEVSSKGMGCSITTSGKGLDGTLIKELMDFGVNHIQISLNGSTQEINSKSRDGYACAIEAINAISSCGMSFGINWTARRDNVFDFPNMVKLGEKFGAENINILRMKPACNESLNQQILLADEFKWLADEIIKYDILKINIKVDSSFSNLLSYIYQGKLNPALSGCGAGRRFMAIDAFGKFKACSHLKGSEECDSIKEFWDNSNSLLEIRTVEESIGEPCNSCSNKIFCRGCRAICYNLYNDFNAGETNCPAYNC